MVVGTFGGGWGCVLSSRVAGGDDEVRLQVGQMEQRDLVLCRGKQLFIKDLAGADADERTSRHAGEVFEKPESSWSSPSALIIALKCAGKQLSCALRLALGCAASEARVPARAGGQAHGLRADTRSVTARERSARAQRRQRGAAPALGCGRGGPRGPPGSRRRVTPRKRGNREGSSGLLTLGPSEEPGAS